MLKRYGLLFLLLCINAAAFAQNGVIKGFVYDRSTGEPMINTSVYLRGTTYGVQTDLNGYFSLTQLPAGEYTLVSSAIGYDTASSSVTLTNGQVVTRKLYLRTVGIQLGDVQVSGRRTAKKTQVNIGVTTVTPREMKLLPSAGGEPDIAQFLQVTPGVVFTGDQGGQLYIRGGAPSQTGILLDGVTIYNPFHTIGLYSVFETDAIRSVDVHSAGFGAQYGNRTSAILDIRTKDGNKNRLSGKLSASPIMARALLEGPLNFSGKRKDVAEQESSTTFLLSFKHSYLDKTSKSLYGGFGEPFSSGLPYAFTDLYGKITFSGANGSKLNLFGFNFDDKAQFLRPDTHVATADFNWNAKGGGTTFVVSPTGSSTLINGKFAYSQYNLNYDEATYKPRSSSISGFEAGIEFTNFLPSYGQLRYGLEVSGYHTTLDYTNTYGFATDADRRNTQASIFVTYRQNFNQRLVIEPGLRIQYYASLNAISPEPRVAMKLNITDNIRMKFAAGLYSQSLMSTKSDRDIVNFFTGFLLSPDDKIYKNPENQTNEVNYNLQKAYHVLGGIEMDIRSVEVNVEPWFKNFTQDFELNRNAGAILPNGRIDENDFVYITGKAYGIDFTAKYNKRRLYLWGVFGYQHVERKDPYYGTYPPPFDRRFNINLLGAYTAGRAKDFELSLRYNMGSPFPFTQTQGFYENLNLLGSGINTNYLQQNGQIGLIYANEINGGRLSYYHRVDISAKKRFKLTNTSNIEAILSITNVTNRNNIFYVDRIANTRVYQLPIFPSLSLTWNF